MVRNLCHLFALFQRKGWDMKSRYVSLRKNPAGSPENKKISYPGKGTVNICLLCISKSNIHCAIWHTKSGHFQPNPIPFPIRNTNKITSFIGNFSKLYSQSLFSAYMSCIYCHYLRFTGLISPDGRYNRNKFSVTQLHFL